MFDTAPRPIADAPGGLRDAVDEVLALDGDDLTDDELRAAMVELRRAQSRLAAAVTELTATFDARRAWADDGSRNAADWLCHHAHRPRSEAASDVRVGRQLRGMSMVRAAWRAGDLSPAHARVLARLAGHPRAGGHFRDGEAVLVDHARRLRFDDFECATRYWLAAADPDGPERDRRRDHDLRRFSLDVGIDGVGHAGGRMTPVGAATVGGALERIERQLFEADLAEARSRLGDAASAADLARTPAQRRHDALVEMAVRAVTAPPDGKRPAPLVTVMVGYEVFAGQICELARGTVIAPGTVAELLGHDATLLERAVFDGPDRLVELSAARTFRGTLRRLLEIRQRRCDHRTCHVPADRCEGDHVIPWSVGGKTSRSNGRLQCGPHNRWSYEQTLPSGATSRVAPGTARGACVPSEPPARDHGDSFGSEPGPTGDAAAREPGARPPGDGSRAAVTAPPARHRARRRHPPDLMLRDPTTDGSTILVQLCGDRAIGIPVG